MNNDLRQAINTLLQGKPIGECLDALIDATYTIATLDPIMGRPVAERLLKLAEQIMDELKASPHEH